MRFRTSLTLLLLSSPVLATTPAIVDLGCLNELRIAAIPPNGDPQYFDRQQVGLVRHQQNRERKEGVWTLGVSTHSRVVAENLDFEGLSGVVQTEYLSVGNPSTLYSKHNDGRLTTWDAGSRSWTRQELVSYPAPVDDLKFSIATRHSARGVVKMVQHFRWIFMPSFRCPYDGVVHVDVFALMMVKLEVFDDNGAPAYYGPQHFHVSYFERGKGQFYGFSYVEGYPWGTLAKPNEATMKSDWIVTVDRQWPIRAQ